MKAKSSLILRLELVWLLFTVLFFGIIITPIWLNLPGFSFYWTNFLFVAVFITASRYIFFLPKTFLANRQVLKIFFFFAGIPLVFFLVSEVHRFQTFLDVEGIQTLYGGLSQEEEAQMGGYVRAEMLLFGVGSVIAMVVFAFRMIWSVWRVHNGRTP